MRAYLVDDEPLAVSRLRRMLEQSGRVQIVGASSDPARALADLRKSAPDVLFLDIEMPGMSGFDLIEKLGEPQPLVVFTTAYDQYALEAFKVNSIDYLLKPVERTSLDRALAKTERILHGAEARGDIQGLLAQMRSLLEAQRAPEYLSRVTSRVGDKVEFVVVADVTHFYAKDKVTFAATAGKHHILNLTIAELEQKLDPRHWVRIHRSTLLNIDAVKELYTWFGGRLMVRLKDARTELQVARERASEVRSKLGV